MVRKLNVMAMALIASQFLFLTVAHADPVATYDFKAAQWAGRKPQYNQATTVEITNMNTFRYFAVVEAAGVRLFTQQPTAIGTAFPGYGAASTGSGGPDETLKAAFTSSGLSIERINKISTVLTQLRGLSTDLLTIGKTFDDAAKANTAADLEVRDALNDAKTLLDEMMQTPESLKTALAGDKPVGGYLITVAAQPLFRALQTFYLTVPAASRGNALPSYVKTILDSQPAALADMENAAINLAKIESGDYMTSYYGPFDADGDLLNVKVRIYDVDQYQAALAKVSAPAPSPDNNKNSADTTGTEGGSSTGGTGVDKKGASASGDQKNTAAADKTLSQKVEDQLIPVRATTHNIPTVLKPFQVKIDYSTGVLWTRLAGKHYTTTPVAGSNPAQYTIVAGANEDQQVLTTALVHGWLVRSNDVAFGPAIGIAIRGTNETPYYLGGVSLGLGRTDRFIVTYGSAYGRVDRLDGASVGDVISSSTAPVHGVTHHAPFWSFSYNIRL